jgi:major inositol transporter-like SP family MFS transporter
MSHSTSMGEATLPPLAPGPYRKRIGVISIVACLGGLLFGYDTGVANGAEGPMQAELGLSDLQVGVVISSLVFAAAIGALIGGKISDAIGRRTTIIVLAVMFFVGVLVAVLSPSFGILVAGRIILGLAVGGASTVVPVFLAELAPFEIRGSITGRNELAIVSGHRGQLHPPGHARACPRRVAHHVRSVRAPCDRPVLRHDADARVAALARREGPP